MLKSQRHHMILQQLETGGAVLVTTLARTLEVDPVTIRRDLAELEKSGRLHRVHGGAVARQGAAGHAGGPDYARRIAEAAARTIPDGSVVFLGPGPLTVEIVPFLQRYTHLTVITNALAVAWGVAHQHQHTLHIVGGQVGVDLGVFGDPEALRRIHADRMILEAGGLDAERGFTHDDRETAAMARAIVALGAEVIALVAPERLGRAGALVVAPASEIDVLITAREADTAAMWDLSELGVRVILT